MDDIFRRLDEHHQKHRVSHWEGTFRDYLPMALKTPQLAQLAHARVYNMVRSFGVDVDEQGHEAYEFFTHELFGIDDALAKVYARKVIASSAPTSCSSMSAAYWRGRSKHGRNPLGPQAAGIEG